MVNLSDKAITNLHWKALTLRLTTFRASPASTVQPGTWRKAVGEEPDSQKFQPRRLQMQELGPFHTGELNLTETILGTDWRLETVNNDILGASEFPSLGLFEDALDAFVPVIQRWLTGTAPDLARIAFGAVLVLPATDHIMAYEQLVPFVPFELDPNSSDFVYQINRRRPSASNIPDLMINRLSKWSTTKLVLGVQVQGIPFEFPGLELFASQLELDINTVPEYKGVLAKERLGRLLQELVDLGKEIAAKGDIL